MVGLLDLPLELREPILWDVVADTIQEQPENPNSVGYYGGYRDIFINLFSEVSCKPLKRHAMALVHINQQIRFEVIDLVLRRLGQRFNDASVDLMSVQYPGNEMKTSLFATWLSAPFPTTHLNSLHVQTRCFQAFEFHYPATIHPATLHPATLHPATLHPATPHPTTIHFDFGTLVPGFSYVDTAHPHPDSIRDCTHWLRSQNAATLLEFVRKSLQDEPGNASSHEDERSSGAHRNRTINRTTQKLVIDIPVESDPPHLVGGRVRCMFCPATGTDFSNEDFHPIIPSGKRGALILAQSLHAELLRIFDIIPEFQGQDTLPSFLFECVGAIELNVHGRLFRSVNLSRMLAEMPHTEEWNDPSFSRAKFFKWKRAVEEKRKAAGFEVVKQSVQEHNLAGASGLIGSILAARNETLVPREPPPTNDGMRPHIHLVRDDEIVGEELVAFTGNSVLVQEDGTKFSGVATFYTFGQRQVVFNVEGSRNILEYISANLQRPSFGNFPGPDLMRQDFDQQTLEERPKDGEHVVFRGEAMFITTLHGNKTITSGDATFYSRGEDASME